MKQYNQELCIFKVRGSLSLGVTAAYETYYWKLGNFTSVAEKVGFKSPPLLTLNEDRVKKCVSWLKILEAI